MKDLCGEAKEMGIRTPLALDDQGVKPDNVENGMLQINKDVEDTEENMRGMENCCSLISLPCGKGGKDGGNWNLEEDNNAGGGNGDARPGDASDAGILTHGGFVSKYTNDAKEEEMEKNMEEVSNMVGDLRNMAIDRESEIGNQNAQIDRITADDNVGTIGTANKKAQKLLK